MEKPLCLGPYRRHAFYSQKAAELYGSLVYRTIFGVDIRVTAVSVRIDSPYGWEDKEYLGIVTTSIPGNFVPVEE